jgi:hypothetical protein
MVGNELLDGSAQRLTKLEQSLSLLRSDAEARREFAEEDPIFGFEVLHVAG